MPLSWNEIKDRALQFSRDWAKVESEDAEAKSFWDAFFNIYGVSRRRVATFERKVKKLDGKDGYIDLLWKGVLLIEHKSRGKDLDRAYTQAKDYSNKLSDSEFPRYILVSDFARFRLYDLEAEDPQAYEQFTLKDLPKKVKLFGFLAGYTTAKVKDEDPVNIKAAERMGLLHDELKRNGYAGHDLEVLLVRLLFCLFADDTGIWPKSQFHDLILNKTKEDGSDLGLWLQQVFEVLDTPESKRQKALDEDLQPLVYVNGKLYSERLKLAAFTAKTRELLLEAAALDWSAISPAIFGAMFQSVLDLEFRRHLGAHYTSEGNILKLIGPLFLDDLKAELERIGHDQNKLKSFHIKLASLKFLDPACGCGNFLVIAYRELRLLEIEVLRRLYAKQQSAFASVADHVAVNVDQFYGIEIEEFPAQIAQVALWLMDHQMNLQLGDVFEENFARLPLIKSATIKYGPVEGNALRIDWGSVVPKDELSYILGNPPFIGHHLQTEEQKRQMVEAIGDAKAVGVLDFVCAWYATAARFIRGTAIKVAFVSTNSIAQGEQVGILWRALTAAGELHIHFAHRTFKWQNEARGKAAVFCVIIGFGTSKAKSVRLFDYDSPNALEAQELPVSFLNAYLVEAPWVLLENRSTPICNVPGMMYGSKPTDGGHFLFTDDEKIEFLEREPGAAAFVRPFISAHEYLNGERRWVLWLADAKPDAFAKLPAVMERVKAVDAFRKASKAASTRNYPYPYLFRQVTQPKTDYILVPRHTSENRTYIPFGFYSPKSIVADSCNSIPSAGLFHFGVLHSSIHMAWVRYTCGRLKSDFRYSKDIVYNNFPWPESPTDMQRAAIESAAQGVLDARAKFPDSTLAQLYDPNTMPPAMVKAHQVLNRAVDTAYGKASFKSDAERVAFLFDLYQKYTSLLPADAKRGRGKARQPILRGKPEV